MRAPLAGRRAAARRLAAQVRRRLEPVQRVLPVTLPRYEADEKRPAGEPVAAATVVSAEAPAEPAVPAVPAVQRAVPTPEDAGVPVPEDPAARIDAARARLRATIEPPEDPDA